MNILYLYIWNSDETSNLSNFKYYYKLYLYTTLVLFKHAEGENDEFKNMKKLIEIHGILF